MRTAMILHAFTGDHFNGWRNRQPNEILFTAQNDSGDSFSALIPGAMSVQLLAPASRTLPVTSVTRDGEVFRAQLARYDDEPAVNSGVYLASLFAVVTQRGVHGNGSGERCYRPVSARNSASPGRSAGCPRGSPHG